MPIDAKTSLAHTGAKLPPSVGRVVVYAVEDGASLSCFPVDAKELVASGAYAASAPEAPEAAPAGADVPAVSAAASATDDAPAGDEGRRTRRK